MKNEECFSLLYFKILFFENQLKKILLIIKKLTQYFLYLFVLNSCTINFNYKSCVEQQYKIIETILLS